MTTETVDKVRHCLIAALAYKNALFDNANESLYSLDMVRFKLKVSSTKVAEFHTLLDCWTLPKDIRFHSSNKIGGFRNLWVFSFDESSISVGLSLVTGSGKTEAGTGFIEYNPNKVGEQGITLVKMLLGKKARLEPLRYDLAIDYPIARESVRMLKDNRKYGCELSESFTEYLGQRNKPGRVKVYDKQAESKLDFPLTRVELTCDATWNAQQVFEKLPIVFSFANREFDELHNITKAFAIAVQAHLAKGDTLEPWLNLCEPRMKKKLKDAFGSERALSYSLEHIQGIAKQVEAIANGTWKPQETKAENTD